MTSTSWSWSVVIFRVQLIGVETGSHSSVRLYWQSGYLEDDVDNYSDAEGFYRHALDISLTLQDEKLISTSEELVGVVLYHQGKYEQAREFLERSLEKSQK